jgi:hypothetical protein
VLPWVENTDFLNTITTGKSKLDVNFLVDDYIPNLSGFVLDKADKTGILMSQPWNTNVNSIKDMIQSNRVIIAKNWKQIGAFLRRNSSKPP